MSDAITIAPYAPTEKEIFLGTRLAANPLFKGGWKLAAITYGIFQGAGIGLLCAGLAVLTGWLFGLISGDGNHWVLAIFLLFSLLYWLLERALKTRGAAAYRNSLLMKGQTMRIDAKGITFSNGRSRSLMDWRDISGITTHKSMLVPTLSNQGIVIADRMLAEIGDVSELRAQITGWYQAANAGETA